MITSDHRITALAHGVRRGAAVAALAFVCVAGLLSNGCANGGAGTPGEPQGFASPDEAVQALITVVRAGDRDRMRAFVGAEGADIIASGDEVADSQARQKFLALYDEKHSLVDENEAKTLVLGNSDWPFPVPLVKDDEDKKWYFDWEAGREEILNRRIGRNELSTIQVCKAIGDAQREYATRDPDADGIQEYAQKFFSDQGKRNGLYWPTAEGEAPSPLGELVVEATGEGYARKEGTPSPYHGYYYRILTAQGPAAPDGALDYIVNGKMMLGFAVLAYPADYDNSGIMTFMMGPDGVVYQKDLGEQTAKIAKEIKAFDPGEGWKKAE